MKLSFSSSIHLLLLGLAALYAFGMHQWNEALMCSGLSLAFDPFNTQLTWSLRPNWQKGWLLGVLGMMLTCVALSFLT